MGPVHFWRVEIELSVGGRFTFSDMRPEGEAVHRAYHVEIDRPPGKPGLRLVHLRA
jgi:hypothetical protein